MLHQHQLSVDMGREIGRGDFGAISLSDSGDDAVKTFENEALAKEAEQGYKKVTKVLTGVHSDVISVLDYYDRDGREITMPWIGGGDTSLVSPNDMRGNYIEMNEAARSFKEAPITGIKNFEVFISGFLDTVFEFSKQGLFVCSDAYFFKASGDRSNVELGLVFGDFDNVDSDKEKHVREVQDFSSLLHANLDQGYSALSEFFGGAFLAFEASMKYVPQLEKLIHLKEAQMVLEIENSINRNAN